MFVSEEMSLSKLIDHVSGSGFSFAVDIDKSFTCLDLRVLICNAKSLSKINFKGPFRFKMLCVHILCIWPKFSNLGLSLLDHFLQRSKHLPS